MQLCDVRPVDIKNVGKVIKNTKRRYLWQFKVHVDDHPAKCVDYSVMLVDSTVSKKRTVILNGSETILQAQVK